MLNYSISLINLWFAGNGIDTRYFGSIEAQRAYFAPLCQPVEQKNINFNMGDNVSTVINYTDTSNRPIEEIVGSNYAVVRRYSDDGTTIESERYYFAVVRQLSGRNLEVSLRLDSIQTHYFKYKSNIAECHINRACLNRFEEVKGSTTEVKFIGGKDSVFYQSENTNLPKYYVGRNRIQFDVDYNTDSVINSYLAQNQITWLYMILVPNEKLPDTWSQSYLYNDVRVPYVVVCAPIQTNFRVGTNDAAPTSTSPIWYYQGLFRWITNSGLTPYIVSAKLSPFPPFVYGNYDEGAFTEVGDLMGITTSGGEVGGVNFYFFQDQQQWAVGQCLGNNCQGLLSDVDLSIIDESLKLTFNKNDIIGAEKSYKFNPKVNSVDITEITVADLMGNTYTYDLQKLNDLTFQLIGDEPVLPDTTKSAVRVYMLNEPDNVYNDTFSIYSGLITSKDTSFIYTQTALETFNANNKNFSLLQQAQRDYNTDMFGLYTGQRMVNGMFNMASSLIDVSAYGGFSNYSKPPSPQETISLGNAIMEFPRMISDIYFASEQLNAKNNFSKLNETLTLDNIRNSPTSVKNAQSSVIFNSIVNSQLSGNLNAHYYIQVWRAYDNDIERFNDIIVEYGFSYERIGNVSDFDNIRKYFNYIAAEIETIDAPISIQEKNDIRDRFKGIRFWNVDTVDFTLENYEKWLEGDTNG